MSVLNRWPFKTGGFCLAVIHIKIVTPARRHTVTPARRHTVTPAQAGVHWAA